MFRSFIRSAALAVPLLFTLSTAPAWADRDRGHDQGQNRGQGHERDRGNGHGQHGHNVPELDTSVAASAAVLLIGGVFVILGRRRSQKA
ncbi:MAG: hypothetical protein WBV82_31415 [Myxococcaceae bacterium]